MSEVIGNSLTTPTASLTGALSSGATSLTVSAWSSPLPQTGTFRIRIGNELIEVGSVSGTTLGSLTRGTEGTSAVSHLGGVGVQLVLTAAGLTAFVGEGGSAPEAFGPIDVPGAPNVITISPDGTTAYFGDGTPDVQIFGIATDAVIGSVTVNPNDNSPPVNSLAYTPDGSQVWVCNDDSPGTVAVIDTASKALVHTIETSDDGPSPIAFTPDGTLALVGLDTGKVDVIDVVTRAILHTITVGADPIGIAVTPDGSTAVTANHDDNSVSIIDIASHTVTATVTDGISDPPTCVACTPDNVYALVTTAPDDPSTPGDLNFLNLGTQEIDSGVEVGSSPTGIAVTPDGVTAFVADNIDGNFAGAISVVDIESQAVTATLNVGVFGVPGSGNLSSPTGLAVTPDGASILVACQSEPEGQLTKVDVGTLAVGFPLDTYSILVAAPPFNLLFTKS